MKTWLSQVSANSVFYINLGAFCKILYDIFILRKRFKSQNVYISTVNISVYQNCIFKNFISEVSRSKEQSRNE